MIVDARIARTARPQYGAVSGEQLAALGCSPRQRRRRIRAGLLLPLHGAFVVAGSPPSFEQRCMAAVLGAGDHAVLSHRTAAFLYGFDRFHQPEVVDVIIPAGRRLVRHGVRFHCADVDRADRARIRRLPVTGPVRTILDLARTCETADLEAAVDSAIRDRRTDMRTLQRRVQRERRQGKAGLPLLDRVLGGRPSGGAHSELERAFVRLLDTAGLPRPTTQQIHRGDDGRVLRVDCLYERQNLVVELNGHRHHSTRHALARDASRARILARQGRQLLTFTSDEVFHDPDLVVRDLSAFFA